MTAAVDQLYIDLDYLEPGYFVYTASATAAVTAESTQIASAEITASGGADVTALSTVSCAAEITASGGADVTALSSLSAASQRARDNSVAATADSTVSCSASRTLSLGAAPIGAVSTVSCAAVNVRPAGVVILIADSSITSTVNRIADAVCAVSAISSVNCAAGRIITAESIQFSAAGVSLQATVTSSASTDLFSTAVLTCVSVVERSVNVTLTTLVTLSLQGDRTRDTAVSTSSEFSISSNAVATRTGDTAFVVTSTVTADVDRTRAVDTALAVTTSFSAAANTFRSTPAALTSNVQLQATATATVVAQFSAQSTSTATANVTVIRAGAAAVNSTVSVTANNTRTRALVVAAAAEFAHTVNINKLTGYGSTLTASVTVTAQANRFRATGCDLVSTVTVAATATRPVFYTAALVSTAILQVRKRYWFFTEESVPPPPNIIEQSLSAVPPQPSFSVKTLRIDSSRNVYWSKNGNPPIKFQTRIDKGYITKLNSLGEVIWAKFSITHRVVEIKLDYNDSLWAILVADTTFSLVNFNNDGDIVLSKILPDTLIDFDFDLVGNVYVLARYGEFRQEFFPNTITRSKVYTVNASGTIVRQQGVFEINENQHQEAKSIKFRNNRLYIVGRSFRNFQLPGNQAIRNAAIGIYNVTSSGLQTVSVSMFRFIPESGSTFAPTDPFKLFVDERENIFFTAAASVYKFNRVGGFVWAIRFQDSVEYGLEFGLTTAEEISVDKFDNIVFKFSRALGPQSIEINQVYILDQNGTILEQYSVQYKTGSVTQPTVGISLDLDSERNIYISGRGLKGGAVDIFTPPREDVNYVAKLPPDGLAYDDYGNFEYQPTEFLTNTVLQPNLSIKYNSDVSSLTSVNSSDTNITWNNTPSEVDFINDITYFFIDGVDVIVSLASMRAESSLICQTQVNKPANSTLTAQSTLVATDTDFVKAGADLVAVGSKLTIAVKTGRTLVTLESSSTVSAVGRADLVGTAALNSISTAAITAAKRVEVAAAITANTTVVCNVDRIRPGSAAFASTVSVTVAAGKQVRVSSNLSSTAVLTADASITLSGAILLSSQIALSATAIATRRGSSNLNANSQQVSNVNRLVGFECDMSAFNSVLATGTLIRIDPFLQLVVPRELRARTVTEQTGVLTADSENRLNTVQAHTTMLIVPSDTRILTIAISPQQGTRRVK